MTPSSDSSSLLVPVHLDAWAVNTAVQNGTVMRTYQAQYANLELLETPIATVAGQLPETGVHLHWALPDALTRGHKADATSALEFPLVPNRWLVVRFETPPGGAWGCTAWVVQSDFVGATAGEGTSPFLDPFNPSYMTADATQTTYVVNQVNIGTSMPVANWQEPATGQPPYLTAAGPANASFAAYAGFVNDVFSFVDTSVAPAGSHTYTYMVVGWYSDPGAADPLRGITTYLPPLWASEAEWAAQTLAQRFATILADARWSIAGDPPASPPTTSLYHGTVVGLSWPPDAADSQPPVKSNDVTVAVANTSVDALAALIRAAAQANAADTPADAPAWTAAGDELAGLVQAAMYDLLDDYGTPGGSVLLSQHIEDAWFGSAPGGTLWDAVGATPQAAGQSASSPQLTPAQSAALAQQLGQLNADQRALDEAKRQLASLQAALYGMWLRVGRSNHMGWGQAPTTTPPWTELAPFMRGTIYPGLIAAVEAQVAAVAQQASALPDPTDPAGANAWAEKAWSFPGTDDPSQTVTLSALGLELKAGAAGRFWHPTDPVVMLSGANRSHRHGEDGRLNPDGTMTCRLPGQTIAGVQIAGEPEVTLQALQAHGLAQNLLAAYAQVPSVPSLIAEAFLADTANAPAMTQVVGGDATLLGNGISALLEGTPTTGSAWEGVPPAPFALVAGSQAWAPLYLEWSVTYYPTGSGTGQARPFSIGDWSFDGQDLHWLGTGFELDDSLTLSGRTLLTPQAPLLFHDKIEAYLKAHSALDSAEMEALLATVAGWDLLSQSLSGLTDQLVTLLTQETFPPSSTGQTPDVASLIGDEYRYVPILSRARGAPVSDFYPLRGGLLQFTELNVVDAFGQTVSVSMPNTESGGFEPVIGQGLVPDAKPAGFPDGAAQLAPRVVQDTRLDFRFLANDGSGIDIALSPNPNPVCGWLLPNHLDGAIAVYDAAGVMLGELVPLGDNWRPRPGPPSTDPPPANPSQIANATLRSVVESIAAQSATVFEDVLSTIDETLWMVDPLGGRKDLSLSVLIGRPLAVVNAQLGLSLMGTAAFDQAWNAMAEPKTGPPMTWTRETGDVSDVPFGVRLGDLDIRADGLIGYFLPSESYATFHTVHLPEDVSAGDAYLKQIATAGNGGPPAYQGAIALQVGGPRTTVTLVMDPRGPVHAFTGILPVTTASVPSQLVEDFIRQLAVTFRTGPIVADPGTMRIPLPAHQQGAWDWVQANPLGWEQDPIVDTDDIARLPDAQLQLREGWLRLTGVDDS
jgi:hypothetical protein